MAISHIKILTQADMTGTVTVFNSAGSTATVAATDLNRPSDWNSVHNQYLTIAGNTAGQSTVSGTNIVWAGGNNMTLSANGSTVSVVGPDLSPYLTTARASNDGIGLNSALTANGVSMTANSSGLSLNFPAFLTTQSAQAFSADASSTFQTLSFQDSNGISFSNNAGAVRLTHGLQFTSATSAITSNALHSSASRVINIVAATNNTGGGTASLSSNVSFTNANGATFYTSAGGAVAMSYTVPTVTNSSMSVSDAATSGTLARLAFTNLNGITLSLSSGAGGSHTIVGSHNALTTARASTDAIGLNTAQSNVTWTVNSSGLSFDARGYAGTGTTFNGVNVSGSMTVNSVGVNLSLSAGAGGTINQTGPNIAAGTQTGTSGTIVFSNSNGISFGMSNSSIVTASFDPINIGVSTMGNTAGTTGTVDGAAAQFLFVGSNDLTLSQSINGQSVSLTFVGPPKVTLSGLVIAPFGGYAGPLHFAQSSVSLGQNSLHIYPVQVEDYLTCDHIRMPVFVTNSSSASASVQKGYTYLLGIYTRNATNATVLSRHYSTSHTLAASHNSNASWMLSMITAIGNSTSYSTLSASSAGVNLSSSLHGPREFIFPVSSLLTPGEYWFAVAASTSSAGAGGAILNFSNMAVAHQTFNRPGIVTNSTASGWQKFMGAGVYSATTGAMPAGISVTQINQAGTFPIFFAATGTV